MVEIIEKDAIYEFNQVVPFWMTRFNLFSDDQWEKEDFLKNFEIVYMYLDGSKSILEISELIGCDFDYVYTFIKKMECNSLVKKS